MTAAPFDYRFKFKDLARALTAMAALRAAGILGTSAIPLNMLGDPRDSSGNTTADEAQIAWLGRRGTGDGGSDPASWYIHIRSEVDPASLPFSPVDYGLTPSDPAESAAVLGVWA